jgi:hypothetical protein|tara:strand:+ start:5916 stop:10748 length:4833 start_codon:yes stop_codon:yes gene_type:complete
MATLIQSKQIQGVVTASVIEGDFSVGGGGSVNLSAASGVTGSFTGSFIGDGSGLNFGGTGIVSRSSQLIPTFDGLYLEINGDGIVSSSAQLYGDLDSRYLQSETDSQTLSISGNSVTISNGNSITIPNTPIPSGTVSSSAQIAGLGYITSDDQNLTFNQASKILTISEGNSVDLSTLGGGGGGGSSIWTTDGGTYKVSANLNVTGSITATSLIGSLDYTNLTNKPSGIISGSVLRTLGGTNVVSGSVLRTLGGTNVISGSVLRNLGGTNVISGSVLRTLEGTDVISGSVLRTLDGTGVISGSVIRTFDGTGILSGSKTDISSLNTYTSSADSRLASIEAATGSYLTSETDSQTLSISGDQLTISTGNTITIPSGSGGGTTDYTALTNVPSGIISGSVLRTLEGTNVVSGSVLRNLDGTGVVSGSVLRTLDGTNVLSGSKTNISSLNTFTSSIQSEVDALSAATSSYLTSETDSQTLSISGNQLTISTGNTITIPSGSGGGSSDFTTLTNVPSGIVSGSSQITDGSNLISGSVLRTLGGTNVVSGSVLRNLDGTGVISGSVLRNLGGTNVISGSVIRTFDGSGVISGSVLRNLDGSGAISGSVIRTLGGTNVVSSSAQLTYNGNRVVSNTDLPSGVYNNNFGTSGSVEEFITKIFFPNTTPSITTGNQTIEEYRADGSTIVTIAGTDAEGQSLTFGTSSAYSDDLVRVATNGVVTLNALAVSSSFNTDAVGSNHGHTFIATATDTFNATVEKDITIFVTPNASPKFREGSTGGNIITSVTSNLNENSPNDTLVKRVFFTDTEGDSITITSSSIDGNHFDITKYSTYVDIKQNTGSLDYEQQTQYTFSITASDSHYENGQDSDSRTFLPITINVTDNLAPTLSNQEVSGLNENSSNGTSAGNISSTDNESDSISFLTFDLHKLLLDGSTVTSGSYGGTSQATDPHENPFNMDSSGNVTRKVGIHLNSDIINSYQYRVKVRDNYNAQISSASVVTVPVADDIAATISDNWSAGPYIKESEESGTTIKTTNYGSTQADYNSNQSGTWASSNSEIAINSNGNLSVGFDVSGSAKQSGQSLTSTISFTNTFGTITTDSLSVPIVANDAPTATFTNQTSNLNANLATTNTNLVLIGITDTEGDTPYSASLSGTDASKLNLDYQNSNSSSVYIRANEDLSAGTLNYNLKVTDNYAKSTTYSSKTITIASADGGTIGGDTTSYIIESGENAEAIRDASGFGAGNQSTMTVSYSPNYGSQVVQGSSWNSSNSAISINTSGQLSLALDISGSTTSSGDDIVSTIGFQDQYGNAGSGTVTVNVFANQAPTATFTNQTSNFETDNATTGTTMVSMSISDTETDTPFSASLSGTDASSLQLRYVGATSSSVGIQAAGNLSAATYNYNIRVTDNFDKSTDYNSRSFTVATSADYGKVYVYDCGFNNSTYNTALGIGSQDSSTPPIPTPFSNIGFMDAIINDDKIGDSSFTYSYGGTQTATKLAEGSGANVHDVLRAMGSSGVISRNSSKHFVIIFPSTSDMSGIPTTTIDAYGGSVTGRYVLEVGTDGTTVDGSNTLESSQINQITLGTAHLGYTNWYLVGASNQVASSTNFNLGLNPASGSGGA